MGGPMDGFADRWNDPEHYILGITEAIWEQRGLATLRHWYSDDVIVRSPAGVVTGNEGVIGATMATLAEFPDRQLLGEDVIWSDDPDGGFLSSHRIISTATHTGDGVYGAATGATLRYRIIADCAARDDAIHDEWLIRDQGAIVRQLGWDPKEYAAERIELEGGRDVASRPFTPATDVVGRYRGTGNDHETGRRHAEILGSIMSGDLAAIPARYDRAAHLELPGGVTAHGWEGADRFWAPLRAAFPTATFTIHHVIGRDDDGLSPRSALRWSLDGEHSGFGAFGEPTGAHVHVMGLSHAEFGRDGLRREWVLFDETEIWKQILLG